MFRISCGVVIRVSQPLIFGTLAHLLSLSIRQLSAERFQLKFVLCVFTRNIFANLPLLYLHRNMGEKMSKICLL